MKCVVSVLDSVFSEYIYVAFVAVISMLKNAFENTTNKVQFLFPKLDAVFTYGVNIIKKSTQRISFH